MFENIIGNEKNKEVLEKTIRINKTSHSYIFCGTEGKIKIEQIRAMQRKIAEKPIISSRKVYIIENSDTMTKEAQNCLLKNLE